MDKFLVQKGDYSKLLNWKAVSCDGVPIPFSHCLFIFQDTGLYAETMIKGAVLKIRFEKDGESLGEASVPLPNGARWHSTQTFSFTGSSASDCAAEFLRFYRTLSIFMSKQEVIYKTTLRQYIERDLGETVDETSITGEELDEKIVSLSPVKLVTLYREAEEHIAPHEPTPQKNPCQYAFWVRGHNRKYQSGLITWVRPHVRNAQYEMKGKTYKLEGDELHGDISLDTEGA